MRRALIEDAPEIARLAGELGYPTEPPEMRSRLSFLTDDPDHHIVVWNGVGDRLLGWVHAEHRRALDAPDRVELMGLVVDPSARRSGIGAALLEAAEEWARNRGVDTIRVRSNVARDSSHLFYEKMGFERQKTQHVYRKPLRSADA
jgi:GNAT superfamily N-acetyltransferase